jgi:glycosyltransferase 2 family protein
MTESTKSSPSFPWGIFLKIFVSGGLVVWLLNKIDIVKVCDVIQNLHTGILILVLGVIWITIFTIAKRWQLVARLGGIKAPLGNLTEATFIGAYFNQFLPSSVGGDFFRILALRRHGASINNAVTSVLVDRLFGFISLGILCLLVIPAEGKTLLESDLKWPFLLTMFLLVGVFGGGLLLLFIPKRWHQNYFIRPFHSSIEMVQGALSHKSLFLSLLISSLLASVWLISGLQILMLAFDILLTWQQGTAILPVVMLLTSLPISFAGWGLREGAIIVALGVYGIPKETALALSLVYGVLHLVSSLPGLVLWIAEKRRLKPATSVS